MAKLDGGANDGRMFVLTRHAWRSSRLCGLLVSARVLGGDWPPLTDLQDLRRDIVRQAFSRPSARSIGGDARAHGTRMSDHGDPSPCCRWRVDSVLGQGGFPVASIIREKINGSAARRAQLSETTAL